MDPSIVGRRSTWDADVLRDLVVPQNMCRTVSLHYVLPFHVFSGLTSTYHMAAQRQSESRLKRFLLLVHESTGGTHRTWIVQHPAQDWSATLPITRRRFASIPRSLQNMHPVVAAVNLIEPHAFLGHPTNLVGPTG
jgi:hypothetical protein